MCGLIGAFNSKDKKNVNKWVTYQLQDQLTRGQDGLGTIFIDDNKNIKIERATEITKTLIDLIHTKSKMMILHHRNPTSSENKIQETHPILVSHKKLKYNYYVIHNGIMRNEHLLKEKHIKLGYIYNTLRRATATTWSTTLGTYVHKLEFNDSESFAIEIVRFIDLGLKKIEVDGTWAFIALQVNKKTKKAIKIFYGKDDFNPLNVLAKKGQIKLSSEGEGKPIKQFQLYNFNLNDLKIHRNRHILVHELELKEEKTTITKTDNNHITQRTQNLNPKTTEEIVYPQTYDSHDPIENDPEAILEEANNEIEKQMEAYWDILKNETFLYTINVKTEIKETLTLIASIMKEAYEEYQKTMIDISLQEDYNQQTKNKKQQPIGFIDPKNKNK